MWRLCEIFMRKPWQRCHPAVGLFGNWKPRVSRALFRHLASGWNLLIKGPLRQPSSQVLRQVKNLISGMECDRRASRWRFKEPPQNQRPGWSFTEESLIANIVFEESRLADVSVWWPVFGSPSSVVKTSKVSRSPVCSSTWRTSLFGPGVDDQVTF